MAESGTPTGSYPRSVRRIPRYLDCQPSTSTRAPRGGADGSIRARSRASLRGVLLPPRQGRRAAAAAAPRRRRAAAARLHPAHAPHAAQPPAQRRASLAEALQGNVRVTSARRPQARHTHRRQDAARAPPHRTLTPAVTGHFPLILRTVHYAAVSREKSTFDTVVSRSFQPDMV